MRSSAKQTQRAGLHSKTKQRKITHYCAELKLHRKLRRADAETRALARVVCSNE